SQSIVNGQSASFLVTATGTRPVAYQWRFQGTNLPGATASTLSLSNLQTNQSGNYQAVVTNTGGAATSQVAVLTVIPIADLVTTDSGNQVYEDVNETNNTTVGTNSIRLRSPDLQPIALLTSPSSAQFGASIPFSWVTTNSGSGPAQVAWTDRVYLNVSPNTLS